MKEAQEKNSAAANSLLIMGKFMNPVQFRHCLRLISTDEEGAFFADKFVEISDLISGMPVTYQTEEEHASAGEGAIYNPKCFLHYFIGGCDWYILEKDIIDGVTQAFGFAILNGDSEMAECGFISIDELKGVGAELDLHFSPTELKTIKAKHGAR